MGLQSDRSTLIPLSRKRAYNLGMRSALWSLLLTGFSAFGQSAPADQAAARLDSILASMKDPGASQPALSQQLADVILSLAQPDHTPSRGTVHG